MKNAENTPALKIMRRDFGPDRFAADFCIWAWKFSLSPASRHLHPPFLRIHSKWSFLKPFRVCGRFWKLIPWISF